MEVLLGEGLKELRKERGLTQKEQKGQSVTPLLHFCLQKGLGNILQ